MKNIIFKFALLASALSADAGNLDLAGGTAQNFCFTAKCRNCEVIKKDWPTIGQYDSGLNLGSILPGLVEKVKSSDDMEKLTKGTQKIVEKTMDKIVQMVKSQFKLTKLNDNKYGYKTVYDLMDFRSYCYGNKVAELQLKDIILGILISTPTEKTAPLKENPLLKELKQRIQQEAKKP